MNLSNLVHRTNTNTRNRSTSSPTSYSSSDPHTRLRNDHRQDMTALVASPYISQSPVYTRSPQPPPSPPDDPNILRTLPSIQSLIAMDVPQSDQGQQCQSCPTLHAAAELIAYAVEAEGQSMPHHSAPRGNRSNSASRSQVYSQPAVSNPTVPPSPPIDPQLGFDIRHQSPSATSSHSSTSAPQYLGGALNNIEPHQQRQQPPPPTSQPGHMMPSQPSQSPYQSSPYPPSPSAASNYSYPSPAHPNSFAAGPAMYNQRPLPNNFPPPLPTTVSHPMPNSQEASPIDPNNPSQFQHQHHHYIAQSSATNFSGQSQDRYVCQVCNKAFSRPSSLRIHSHSHTGEKPFVCPHKGCGKAFSVRSNMKRHERGCHGGGSPASS